MKRFPRIFEYLELCRYIDALVGAWEAAGRHSARIGRGTTCPFKGKSRCPG
jgi:hypothetical protein